MKRSLRTLTTATRTAGRPVVQPAFSHLPQRHFSTTLPSSLATVSDLTLGKNLDISPSQSALHVSPSVEMLGFDVTESSASSELGRPIYLDAQATTPTDPRVLDAMLPYMTNQYGNPHSKTHAYGWETEKAVEEARKVSEQEAEQDASFERALSEHRHRRFVWQMLELGWRGPESVN